MNDRMGVLSLNARRDHWNVQPRFNGWVARIIQGPAGVGKNSFVTSMGCMGEGRWKSWFCFGFRIYN
jgi:hypothetical protein